MSLFLCLKMTVKWKMEDLKSEGNNSGFCEDDLSFAKATLGKNVFATQEDDLMKILGVNWDTKNDMLVYDFNELIGHTKSLPVTKWSIFSLSARIFDPLWDCFHVIGLS